MELGFPKECRKLQHTLAGEDPIDDKVKGQLQPNQTAAKTWLVDYGASGHMISTLPKSLLHQKDFALEIGRVVEAVGS